MKYLVRLYITSEEIGLLVNDAIDVGLLTLTQSHEGKEGIIAIYDGYISRNGLVMMIDLGVKYFPLDNYQDFIITCPNCGERIDDKMIYRVYDDNFAMGYNIKCERHDCGMQMANVEFLRE